MAIIVCPECGGNISSSTNKCVHCGCNIQVCQECNTVYAQKVTECTNCGYKFTKKQEKKLQPIEIFNRWKNDSIVNTCLFSNNYLNMLFEFAGVILLIIAIISFVQWSNSDAENMLLNYKDISEQVKNLLIFSTIFSILGVLTDSIVEHFSKVSLGEYAIRNKYNLIKSIYDTEEDKLSNYKMTYKIFSAGFYLQNLQYKEKSLISAIISSLFKIVGAIFLYIFVTEFVAYVMPIKLLQVENYNILDFEKWWALIVSVVLLIIGTIINKIYSQKETNAIDIWVEKLDKTYIKMQEDL